MPIEAPSKKLPPLPPEPGVSVFMPVRDAERTIVDAISSVRRQAMVSEIVVAVGPSADRTREVLEELQTEIPELRVVENPSGLIPRALNAAGRATSGDVLVRVDAHSILPAGYVEQAVQALRRTGAANVGGIQRPVGGEGGFREAVALAMASVAGSGGATYRVGAREGPADTVFLGVFRRQALDAVGWYDERFQRNEDAELNLRLAEAGYAVWFTPQLSVDYRPRGDLGSLLRQYYANGRWRRLTGQVHPGSLKARQLVPSLLAAVLGATTLASLGARRAGLLMPWLAYGGALTLEGVRVSGKPNQGLKVAVALAAMHLAFGVGFLVGPPPTR